MQIHFVIAVPGRPIANIYISDVKTDESALNFHPSVVLNLTADGYLCSQFFLALTDPKISSLFMRYLRSMWRKKLFRIHVSVTEPLKPVLDSRGGRMFERSAQQRRELDSAMAFFSTLGGAFSALGDSKVGCAVIAGKISIQQFRLALQLGDPFLLSRCRLYMALSLIQLKKFKVAKKILLDEYRFAKSQAIVDSQLVSMCLGIWAKLRYEWSRWKSSMNSRSISL